MGVTLLLTISSLLIVFLYTGLSIALLFVPPIDAFIVVYFFGIRPRIQQKKRMEEMRIKQQQKAIENKDRATNSLSTLRESFSSVATSISALTNTADSEVVQFLRDKCSMVESLIAEIEEIVERLENGRDPSIGNLAITNYKIIADGYQACLLKEGGARRRLTSIEEILKEINLNPTLSLAELKLVDAEENIVPLFLRKRFY